MSRRKRDRGLTTTLFAWNDLLTALLSVAFVVIAVFAVHVSMNNAATKTEDEVAIGTVSVYIFWRDGIDMDIDMHLLSPGGTTTEGEHVYYGHLSGQTWNLLRDDLGSKGDDEKRNFENAATRGSPPGEYVINIHSFRGAETMYPIDVEVEVRFTPNPGAGKGGSKIIRQTVTLTKTDQEVTAVRFVMGPDKLLVESSINHVYKPIVKKVVEGQR